MVVDVSGVDPEPLVYEEGELLGYECPDCGTLKTTVEKAREHCASTESEIEDTGAWDAADFTIPESDVWPSAWEDCRFWMTRKGKMPFAPWGDPDHLDGNPEKDARFSWSIPDNWGAKATVDEWVDKDSTLDGHAVILQRQGEPYADQADPFAFVDGDDVRCPETGKVHPAFIELLNRLGLTYADVSQSGSGVHALYEGQLPEGVKQAVWQLDDEPWRANDDPPSVEIYDGKRVCVVTGEHVPGSVDDVRPWDDEALEAVLDEHMPEQDRHTPPARDTDTREDPLEDYEPTVTGSHKSTDELKDVYYAVENLRLTDLPLRAEQVGIDGTGWEKWDPSTYRPSGSGESLHRPPGETVFYDHKTGHSFGALALFAAEQGIISKPWHDLSGAKWFKAVDAARDAGAPIPELVGTTSESEDDEPVVVLPHSPRARAAANGWTWQQADHDGEDAVSAQEDIQERTQDTIGEVMDWGESVVVDSIMGGGKTYGFFAASAERDADLAYFAPREELYEQAREYAIENGYTRDEIYIWPSINRDCPTFAGEHGDEWKRRVRALYSRGATPKLIHNLLDDIPCKDDGK